ncbi:hypothetical protein [Rhizobium ruizarguesonis]|uniref:hypothetical protein n=1 Tax=Rhizobium ruizarguesonis TaxID=2081791 RepID=UPI002E10D3A7|nr:hypothetical protein U8Q07_02040 [Rhizobium ruizarguesonis]WSH34118.1 hypothetical protein U8P70_02040 [Rhizobium ruizarguesonis]
MLDASLKEELGPMKTELYHAYLAAWCFKRKIENLSHRLETETREFLLEELTSLRALANEIVLRLCSLDDDKSRYSFHAANKVLGQRSAVDPAMKTKLAKAVTKYRKTIGTLKTQHRNRYIAHLSGDHYPDPFLVTEMVEGLSGPLAAALDLISLIWGAKQSFGFHLGSRDRTIDFVTEIATERKAKS